MDPACARLSRDTGTHGRSDMACVVIERKLHSLALTNCVHQTSPSVMLVQAALQLVQTALLT